MAGIDSTVDLRPESSRTSGIFTSAHSSRNNINEIGDHDDPSSQLLDRINRVLDSDEDDDDSSSGVTQGLPHDELARITGTETAMQFIDRHYRNLVHFLVEDWFLSAALGVITAILSIATDIGIEYLVHVRLFAYDIARAKSDYLGFAYWIFHIVGCGVCASLVCKYISRQAAGSGIPEIKVIISGFVLKNYLSIKTLFAKIIGLIFTIGGGLPVGKEGPFVHLGAIVANQLTKATASRRYNQFFGNEGRSTEMLASGCAVGIACTFSAPAGGVLYGIESTSKYFALKNYGKSFFATTCAALVFRFAIAVILPSHMAGTLTAYYQTNFPNEVFVVEEIPFFMLLGVFCGLAGALFVYINKCIVMFQRRNKFFQATFAKYPISFTCAFAAFVGLLTYPEGLGRFIAGRLTFRETLVDFISNCTILQANKSDIGCNISVLHHWDGGDGSLNVYMTMALYALAYYLLVANCITLFLPSGIFVPAFVVGACGGRLMGEIIAATWPEGMRGLDSPQIYPGLYAVVGAAAYTGAVTHSLSIAVIVCETTGQLCPLLPMLIALMIANAICAFLQPSIYESTIILKNLPYLTDLPPSRISVHTMKVDKVMVKDIVYISRDTTYQQLIEIVASTPHLRSYPFVTDEDSMNLIGSVSRKYLMFLLLDKVGPDSRIQPLRRNGRKPSEVLSSLQGFRRSSSGRNNSAYLTDRNVSGPTVLPHSFSTPNPLASMMRGSPEEQSMQERAALLASHIDIQEMAIDAAPFQLVSGTSLYKVHTLFSFLGLNHAYVTERGRLVGVVSLKELRETFADIYVKGAQPPKRRRRRRQANELPPGIGSAHLNEEAARLLSTTETTNGST